MNSKLNTTFSLRFTAPKTKYIWRLASKRLREAILKVYKGRAEEGAEVQPEGDDVEFLMTELKDVMSKEELQGCRQEILYLNQKKEVGN